jgi:hypothetical protein
MAPLADDRCGSRLRRSVTDLSDHSTLANGDVLTLSPRGVAFLDALRDDPRYRDLLADPFGDAGD